MIMTNVFLLAEEALNMLQSEKTPKQSSATIRKDLAEKAAAELRAKVKCLS